MAADFDGQLIDVIAEGLPIDRDQQVVVLKARANRVVVRGERITAGIKHRLTR